ncbi:permease (plasmid) [Gemmatirosa kalamazoonensis]|uniref:Permease n=1 Tax=Gemmatirosa kalamazoonensis TaxID=861299 RepID=W0RUF5_9BACT|nr:ABC transporter permease [Gemmatirosa kalamazoonensis]AHG93183.1 permease [Gemmatirosa kalamazoonensis]
MVRPRIENVARDIVHASRTLRRNRTVTAVAVAILALGIGANTTIFRFVSALLLQPAPVEAPERLLQLWNVNRGARSPMERFVPLSYPAYAYYRDHAHGFTGLLAFDGDPATLSWMRGGRGEMVQAQFVSGNFFSVLGVRATLGTTALPADEGRGDATPTVVVSHRFWREQLGGEPTAVGSAIMLNGVAFTVAGVAPPGFTGLLAGLAPDVWAPLATTDAVRHEHGRLASRSTFWLMAVGRLAPRVTAPRAAAEVRVLARRVAAEDRLAPVPGAPPDVERGTFDAAVYPATLVPGPFRVYVGAFVGLLQAVVVMLLLIAGANAANLFLAQATTRRPEMALRSSLGATRARLVQLVLVETTLLGALAGIAGLLVARQTAPLLLRLVPPTLPLRLGLAMDWRVVAFASGTALLTGLLFGLGPALRATSDLAGILRLDAAGGRRGARLRNALVVTQIAMSLVLLVGGALCWQSLRRAQSADPGFDVRNRVAAELDLGSLGYTESAGRALQRRLMERVAALPGVRRASATQYLPLATTRMAAGVRADGTERQVQTFDVGPGYFATMGTPLLRGREFGASDDERSAPVVVVNEALARALWSDGDAVGRALTVDVGAGPASYQVIGVVTTGKYRSLGERPTPALFRAERQTYRARLTIVAEVAGVTPTAALGAIRREVAHLDPSLVLRTGTLEEHLGFALFPSRASGIALGAAGALGLVLALAGLAAVVAQSVAQRTREIGIRMALGADRRDILGHVVRDGARLLGAGVAVGVVAALGATRFLSGLLFGIGATDPRTFVGVVAGLVVTSLGACLLVARRATRIDPISAMRGD